MMPIGWIADGNPARILPPDQPDASWAVQERLNIPKLVYGVERAAEGVSNMPEITRRRPEALASHKAQITWLHCHELVPDYPQDGRHVKRLKLTEHRFLYTLSPKDDCGAAHSSPQRLAALVE